MTTKLTAEDIFPKTPKPFTAHHLSGANLGNLIRFKYTFPRTGVQAEVTGILVRIAHDETNMVFVSLMPDGPAAPEYDGMEPFAILPGVKIDFPL